MVLMDALLLLLIDSRAPAGAHHHSGGVEPAIATGLVRDIEDVAAFCRTKLATGGYVAAAFAAASCATALSAENAARWAELDAEYDARMPAESLRTSSRALARGLLRLLRASRPGLDTTPAWNRVQAAVPHHPLVLGAAVAACGGDPELAAKAAALASCTGPASAAVRLLGLDPLATHSLLARLAADIDGVSLRAARAARDEPARLPADSAPALDLLADVHVTSEVRLFAS